MSFDPVKLQDQSTGVLPDTFRGPSIRCEYYQDNVANKAEKYVYRCSTDKVCCGGQCCSAIATAGFPLWLLIVILVLCFLLVILLLFIIIYYCCNWRNRNAKYQSVSTLKNGEKDLIVAGTPPKVEIYKKQKPLATAIDPFGAGYGNSIDSKGARQTNRTYDNTTANNQHQKRQEQATVLTDIESGTGDDSDGPGRRYGSRRFADSGGNQQGNVTTDRFGNKILPFEPSPMEESFEKAPRPIPITYHDRSEIGSSSERKPLVTNRLRPEEQKARMVYYKSEANRSESFNEHAEYDDD